MGKKTIDIYQYLDHQMFLRAWYENKVSESPSCSLQWLANKLGVKSRGYVHRMLHDASRPMSRSVQERWITLLGLSNSETEYFRAMVAFCSAEKPEDKARCFETMRKTLTVREAGKLLADRYEFLSCWWLPALRELALAKNWRDDWDAMAKEFMPPLTGVQVRKGMELLERLGLLVKEKRGVYRQVDAVLRTSVDVLDLAIYNYHKEQLERSRQALELPVEERELGGITFGLPAGGYRMVRDRIREFQEKLLAEFGAMTGKPQEIVQFNVQMFHVTKKQGSGI